MTIVAVVIQSGPNLEDSETKLSLSHGATSENMCSTSPAIFPAVNVLDLLTHKALA